MAFVTLNGYDVEHASQLLTYENLFPTIQHINGKGVTDKYTPSEDVTSVTYIDIIRILAGIPNYRQLGATNNGGFHNISNEGGYRNAPQSMHKTISVDLIFDTNVPITSTQIYSNKIELKEVVLKQLVQTAGMAINIITYAKQIEGFFRNKDNFNKTGTHSKGAIVAGDITAAEIANAVFQYDPAATGLSPNSPTLAFINANASLTNGIPELGAYFVPVEERQAFITPSLNTLLRSQYAQNASEASARILATGFLNPFNQSESARIDSRTGLFGMYDGVDLFMYNNSIKTFVYIALGILGTANDSAETLVALRTVLDKMNGMIVYGAGTCRGIVGPHIVANTNPVHGGVIIHPEMKCGVEVLHGASIKMIVNAGTNAASGWTAANIAALMNGLTFTPIDGQVVTGFGVLEGFNDGTTN